MNHLIHKKKHGIESGNRSEIPLCELKNTKNTKDRMCELVYRMKKLNPGIGLKQNGSPLICCTNIYNEDRIKNIAIIAISIFIVLSIVYKVNNMKLVNITFLKYFLTTIYYIFS